MKKIMGIWMLLLVLSVSTGAMAQSYTDMPPQAVLERFGEERVASELSDYISIDLPDGTTAGFVLTAYGFMDEYRLKDGEWSVYSQVSPTDGLWQARFVRHDTQSLRADGTFYPDALGFDLVCETSGNAISYHFNGSEFEIVGWKNPGAYDGEVILRDHIASYYPTGQQTPEMAYAIHEMFSSIMMDFDDLPAIPADGQRLASVTEEALQGYYPGYTLASYAAYNSGSNVQADFFRIENGALHVIRTTFSKERPQGIAVSCMPVPLSPQLLARLETEDFDNLLCVSGSEELFKTADAYDLAQIPVGGRIIDSHLQQRTLVLLMEEADGTRRVHLVEEGIAGEYSVQSTSVLPSGTSLDIFHANDGSVQLEWIDQGKQRSACYVRGADGAWWLNWVMNGGDVSFDYNALFCGVQSAESFGVMNGIRVGTLANSNLLQADIAALPATPEQAAAQLDRSGWAVVNNPNPADRLHLREKPERGARSIGKFYNGTPIRVLDEHGDWCKVQIGLDGHLKGWMMKKYLAFGEKMDEVTCAFPQKFLLEEYKGMPLYGTAEKEELYGVTGEYGIAGVVGDELYVILTTDGGTGYAPQEWFFDGNG